MGLKNINHLVVNAELLNYNLLSFFYIYAVM